MKNNINNFIELTPKQIFPDLPDDPRKDGGMITQKQIRYIYVLIKQYDISKEDLEQYEFAYFDTTQARNFIDIIKERRFYCFDMEELNLTSEERQQYIKKKEEQDIYNLNLNDCIF